MSFSGQRGSREVRDQQYREDRAERERIVRCKGLMYLHQTDKAILVQEGPDLAGLEWKIHGKQSWLPKARVRSSPSFNTYMDRFDPLEFVDIPKWLADEKEMIYE